MAALKIISVNNKVIIAWCRGQYRDLHNRLLKDPDSVRDNSV